MLLSQASELEAVDAVFRTKLTPASIQAIVGLVPDEWLANETNETAADKHRIYIQFLLTRIETSQTFVKEALHARQSLI